MLLEVQRQQEDHHNTMPLVPENVMTGAQSTGEEDREMHK